MSSADTNVTITKKIKFWYKISLKLLSYMDLSFWVDIKTPLMETFFCLLLDFSHKILITFSLESNFLASLILF